MKKHETKKHETTKFDIYFRIFCALFFVLGIGWAIFLYQYSIIASRPAVEKVQKKIAEESIPLRALSFEEGTGIKDLFRLEMYRDHPNDNDSGFVVTVDCTSSAKVHGRSIMLDYSKKYTESEIIEDATKVLATQGVSSNKQEFANSVHTAKESADNENFKEEISTNTKPKVTVSVTKSNSYWMENDPKATTIRIFYCITFDANN